MVFYNITINIDSDREEEFIDWMKQEYFNRVMQTGLFFEKRFFRLLQENNGNGVNFSAQFFAENLEDIEFFQERYADVFSEIIKEKFGSQFVYFQTVLESID